MTHSHKTLLIYNGPARGKVIVCRDADGLSELATALSSAACVYAGEIEPAALSKDASLGAT